MFNFIFWGIMGATISCLYSLLRVVFVDQSKELSFSVNINPNRTTSSPQPKVSDKVEQTPKIILFFSFGFLNLKFFKNDTSIKILNIELISK